ncbi:hypothetical protein MY04_5281 [Flammeovirga sp. MY04]|uniref:hypothetical protein n=1 Tax=Flammeovirga sp. MY04 TaxID=1191459 RepID=UPI0008061A17|nr:hypothetical protein [Flammeovirga sp. MY04]ANQ52613.1 hypothetical protein MY04_5281 [Flammeovirga sp. MY04]
MKKLVTISLLFIIHFNVNGQTKPKEEFLSVHLEAGVKVKKNLFVHDTLDVIYEERYKRGTSKSIISFYSVENQLLGKDTLKIQFGFNRLYLDLTKYEFLYRNKWYVLEIEEKYGQLCQLQFYFDKLPQPFRPITTLEKVSLNCEEGENSLFKIRTELNGGTSPYDITYIISKDKEQKQLLFEPFSLKNKEKFKDYDLLVEAYQGFYIKSIVMDNCMEVYEELIFTDCKESTKIQVNLNLLPNLNQQESNKQIDQ